jgi:hypothetical protein
MRASAVSMDEKTLLWSQPCTEFQTIDFKRAVVLGLIDPGDAPPSACEGRFSRITEWYHDGEGDMLSRAVDQLAGCDIILVSKPDVDMGCMEVAIFRAIGEIKDTAKQAEAA